jgi:hypothetical protein
MAQAPEVLISRGFCEKPAPAFFAKAPEILFLRNRIHAILKTGLPTRPTFRNSPFARNPATSSDSFYVKIRPGEAKNLESRENANLHPVSP